MCVGSLGEPPSENIASRMMLVALIIYLAAIEVGGTSPGPIHSTFSLPSLCSNQHRRQLLRPTPKQQDTQIVIGKTRGKTRGITGRGPEMNALLSDFVLTLGLLKSALDPFQYFTCQCCLMPIVEKMP
ncbi:uncharacterized protein BO97DRAFT_236370 [Aspergillus homomorphus CBS 101889]|uniref:Uncharacterized protein n=1 Tax=Aspergillus homomorphus (strain CBS 101889) TaxID=1450537 RepID=A0A395I6I0_ASPHC|nr:hypothetical protein BO97DRAFT_236370 [Aspergillus homomorphus CBS 101889]RAL15033.1 hypothetical protein BO97DRAFT_236370 [Aspergillus homomorphus CBS 101889]